MPALRADGDLIGLYEIDTTNLNLHFVPYSVRADQIDPLVKLQVQQAYQNPDYRDQIYSLSKYHGFLQYLKDAISTRIFNTTAR